MVSSHWNYCSTVRRNLCLLLLIALITRGQALRRRCAEDLTDLRKELSRVAESAVGIQRGLAAIRRDLADLAGATAGALPEDCSVAKRRGSWGPFQMIAPPGIAPRVVRCDMTTNGGGWTVALWREPIQLSQMPETDYSAYDDEVNSFENVRENVNHNSFPIRSVEKKFSTLNSEKDPDRPSNNDFLPAWKKQTIQHSRLSNVWKRNNRDKRSQKYAIRHSTDGIQRQNFNRTWREYKLGFGHHTEEHWIGNDVLHALTTVSAMPWEAMILLSDWRGNRATAAYGEFSVSEESKGYRLHAEQYMEKSSTAGDGLAFHHQRSFSTYDRDNDEYYGSHCGQDYGAGWWFHQCHVSLLTGAATSGHGAQGGAHTMHWRNWRGEEALRTAVLMIRPKV